MKLASRFFIFIFLIFSQTAQSKLLDKISAIVDNNIITLSQIKRLNQGLAIKKNVAPMIYDRNSYTEEQMLDLTINKYLIRSKLAEIGYTITDDQVEAQIKQNQERLGVDKNALMGFLRTQNTTYDEYFETLREAIEYSYFINRVIQPMISVSEQDVKNSYYKSNLKDASRMNFKYSVVDYLISKEFVKKPQAGELEAIVKQYRQNTVLPEQYSELNVINLDDITEDGIQPEINSLLKITDEGALSKMLDLNGQYHVFYVTKKDLVESENYLKQKDRIRNELMDKMIKDETKLWFDRERNKHFIKISL